MVVYDLRGKEKNEIIDGWSNLKEKKKNKI